VWVWCGRVSDLLARSCGRDGAGFGIGEDLRVRERVWSLGYTTANSEAVVEPVCVSLVYSRRNRVATYQCGSSIIRFSRLLTAS
jgi:hypothetical protein